MKRQFAQGELHFEVPNKYRLSVNGEGLSYRTKNGTKDVDVNFSCPIIATRISIIRSLFGMMNGKPLQKLIQMSRTGGMRRLQGTISLRPSPF